MELRTLIDGVIALALIFVIWRQGTLIAAIKKRRDKYDNDFPP
jgi:hypothetical protein